jgi:hypothetical protein
LYARRSECCSGSLRAAMGRLTACCPMPSRRAQRSETNLGIGRGPAGGSEQRRGGCSRSQLRGRPQGPPARRERISSHPRYDARGSTVTCPSNRECPLSDEWDYSALCGGKSPNCLTRATGPRGPSTSNRHEWRCVRRPEPEYLNNLPGHDSVNVTTVGPIPVVLIVVRQVAAIPRLSPGPGITHRLAVPAARGKTRTSGQAACTRVTASARVFAGVVRGAPVV